MSSSPAPGDGSLDDLLDDLVAEYSDRCARGETPSKQAFLARAPATARAGLERCLKMIEAGLASAPGVAVPLAPGLSLGRYRLVRELGRGGMALVWLAQDTELRRPVALKLLRPGLALEQAHVDRFRREALAIARLKHPNVVQIHDVGADRGFHYLAMEYVEGPSLERVLETLGPRAGRRFRADELARAAGAPALAANGGSLEQAVAALLVPVAEALERAHASGIVHRDVKPSNILLRRDGSPVVVDFGLAKADGDPALSISGDTLGTPYYMSPEQALVAGVTVDHRTDVYSLGVTLYEALASRRPFEGASVLEVFERIRTGVPPALDASEPRASRDAAAVARRAMARRPEGRYAGAGELAEDLRALAGARSTAAARAEGGRVRRAWRGLRLYLSGIPFEYRSARTLLGWPLVHVITGPRAHGERRRVARGWLASSPDMAIGFVAMGQVAAGAIAMGGLSLGLVFSWGGIALGLLTSFGGLAAGLFSWGGLSAGYLAMGGVALGYGAIGGMALGHYAIGGMPVGTFTWNGHEGNIDQHRFFAEVLGFALPLLESLGLSV